MSWLSSHPLVLVLASIGALAVAVVGVVVLASAWVGLRGWARRGSQRLEDSRLAHYAACEEFAHPSAMVVPFPADRVRSGS